MKYVYYIFIYLYIFKKSTQINPDLKYRITWLVGGFNPFEKYWSNWIISTRFGVKIENIWKKTPSYPLFYPIASMYGIFSYI